MIMTAPKPQRYSCFFSSGHRVRAACTAGGRDSLLCWPSCCLHLLLCQRRVQPELSCVLLLVGHAGQERHPEDLQDRTAGQHAGQHDSTRMSDSSANVTHPFSHRRLRQTLGHPNGLCRTNSPYTGSGCSELGTAVEEIAHAQQTHPQSGVQDSGPTHGKGRLSALITQADKHNPMHAALAEPDGNTHVYNIDVQDAL